MAFTTRVAWFGVTILKRIFEIFAEGGGNVFGLEFDSDGRLFSGHNGGDTRGWHYIQDAYLLKQGRTPISLAHQPIPLPLETFQ